MTENTIIVFNVNPTRAFDFFPFFPHRNRHLIEIAVNIVSEAIRKIKSETGSACIDGCEKPPNKYTQTADEPNYNQNLLNSNVKWNGKRVNESE